MIVLERHEQIRRAYYVKEKSIRQIERELGHSYWTIRKALEDGVPKPYRLVVEKPAPVLGPYRERIDELLAESVKLPRKQRYTGRKIYQIIRGEGYGGARSTVRRYIGQRRRDLNRPAVFLPLEFDPGQDAQVDWGEAWVEMAGERSQVEFFVMRLCYSRKSFVMAFPSQRQESFYLAHVAAFQALGGVPHRISYDNLTTAVQKVLTGRNRKEQDGFIGLRSHYLFESRFCTPGQGHEKGQVESGIGYVRREFLTPLPSVSSYAELNAYLLDSCRQEEERQVDRQPHTIGVSWAAEKIALRPLPATDYPCFRSHEVTLNPYGQVNFETNRYSIPSDRARKQLTLRAHPFHVEIMADNQVIARHERCYARKQDILEPLHYLPLLAQRPGAFEHAKPLRQWRAQWPALYETLLSQLKANAESESQAIRAFISVLALHQEHPAELVQQAIEMALNEGIPHPQGVLFSLHKLQDPTPSISALSLHELPQLAGVGHQPLHPQQYNQLLSGVAT